jgi:hypothetical protein
LDTQRTGRIFGWFFIATFITSIPARLLIIDGLDTSWSETTFTPGAVSDTSLQLGSILEFLLIGFNIATAVVLYPLVKRLSATLALGYVTARVMESVFIAMRRGPGRVAPGLPPSKHKATRWFPSTTGPSSSGRDSLSASGTA